MVLPSATARTTLTAVMLTGDGHGDVASNNKVLVFPVFIDCEKSVTLVRRGVPGAAVEVREGDVDDVEKFEPIDEKIMAKIYVLISHFKALSSLDMFSLWPYLINSC